MKLRSICDDIARSQGEYSCFPQDTASAVLFKEMASRNYYYYLDS
jgi:hypothetical protein